LPATFIYTEWSCKVALQFLKNMEIYCHGMQGYSKWLSGF